MTPAQHAIITGGSSGIGKETAKLLARRGTNVTIIARRPEVLAAAAQEITEGAVVRAPRVLALSADVADRTAIDAAIARATAENGPCDLLITSAGVARPGYFHELDADLHERAMAVNYLGALYAVQAVAPEMRARRRGHVALVSSGLGIIGVIGYAAYSPTKFALRGLAEAVRGEFRADNVGVSIVYPPDTDTPQLAAEAAFKPPETAAITGGAKTWSAPDVAAAILKGIERRQFAITPGWEMTWLYRLHSVAMGPLNWYFDRVGARARAKLPR
jgi:3-dehydrosphinganine reductase